MDRHSTLVVFAKTVLPLLALTLLSTLFLIARAPTVDESQIPFADLDALVRDQQISAPTFSGVADDGSILQVSAERAIPAPVGETEFRMSDISASMTSPGGDVLTVAAAEGALDEDAGVARLTGGVAVRSSSGYLVEATGLYADLDSGRLTTDGAVHATGPFGSFTAGSMVAETPEGGGPRILFENEVRLVYRRSDEETTSP